MDLALIERFIVMGFGLSMVIYFIGQMLRCLTDIVEIMLSASGRT